MTKEENVPETMTPDLTKYVEAGDPCPWCGSDETDSQDVDIFTSDGGPVRLVERFDCAGCDRGWKAVFTFARLEPIETE